MSPKISSAPADIEQVHVDPELTLACAVATVSAYADFKEEPILDPKGYRYVDRFSGCVKFLLAAAKEGPAGPEADPEERFGLIFRSEAEAGTYLVAFRGTDSIRDIVRDLYIATVAFAPYDAPSFPEKVLVATGFNGVYTAKCDGMSPSMQAQLFDKLRILEPAPKRLLVTGHSLGGALASLFALDLAASLPALEVVSTTFASPRVGTEKWQDTYDDGYGLEAGTFRIANYYDWVPSLPPEWLVSEGAASGSAASGEESLEPGAVFFNYRHVGQQFLAAFKVKDAVWPYFTSRHSMLNYQTVLSHAVTLPDPQIWRGEFKDAVTGHSMISEAPPAGQVPDWAQSLRELEGRPPPKSA